MRIGVTTRVVEAATYVEPRDALAQAWGDFLAAALPVGGHWLPLPNLGAERIVAFCEGWGIDGLILSGGEDPGTVPLRDATEFRLLDWAEENGIPVLGVCRGLQMMAVRAGTALSPVTGHAGAGHPVHGEIVGDVNSFHRYVPAVCPPGFHVTARAPDGVIEAIAHDRQRWEGWMWHPERQLAPASMDVEGLRRVFA